MRVSPERKDVPISNLRKRNLVRSLTLREEKKKLTTPSNDPRSKLLKKEKESGRESGDGPRINPLQPQRNRPG
jgi:hypothetical protein